MQRTGERLRLAYFDESDGPRILIFGPLGADFRSLQDLFIHLSQPPAVPLALHDQAFVVPFRGIEVRLSCSGPMFPRKSMRQGIRRVRGGETKPVFDWQRTSEGWDYLAKLIDPLVGESVAAHQYLTCYPSEDAIVVVSKGEYGDDILE